MKLWFVLVSIIATGTSIEDAERSFKPGDVVYSQLYGASFEQGDCETAASALVESLSQHTGGASVVTTSCVELDEKVMDYQDFERAHVSDASW